MPPVPATRSPIPLHPRPLRVGYLAQTDAAPVLAAEHLGLFGRHGLRVELHCEIGWATLREKVIYGELDAAQTPAPLLWATQLGLGCPQADVLTALILSCGGSAVTLSTSLRDAGVHDPASLRAHASAQRARHPLSFGVEFRYSSHHLLLLEWLRSAGLEPDRDVNVVMVPPAQLLRHLAGGTLDGYCAGEPWGTRASQDGVGWCPAWTAAHSPGPSQKVLLVTRRFAETRPIEHSTLVAALAESCAWCDERSNRDSLAQLLAAPPYLDLPVSALRPGLLGKFDTGPHPVESAHDLFIFHRGDATVPTVAKAAALQRALGSAGLLPAAACDPELPRRLFREDLHRSAVRPSEKTLSSVADKEAAPKPAAA